jgi:hypothetical protein
MTDTRGRHSKNRTKLPSRVALPGMVSFNRDDLLKEWEKLTDKQREAYGYSFGRYRIEHE